MKLISKIWQVCEIIKDNQDGTVDVVVDHIFNKEGYLTNIITVPKERVEE